MMQRTGSGAKMIKGMILALGMAVSVVWAHDGIHDKWYESLKVPGTTGRCCSETDCATTEAELRGSHWWAILPNGQWIEVPDDVVIRDRGNPVGQPVLCAVPDEAGVPSVRCFVPGGLS